ncbi:MAG: barstar family protein [Sterolibacterium sp.]|nr:barstar family protein [Sterolibacterium sp.]
MNTANYDHLEVLLRDASRAGVYHLPRWSVDGHASLVAAAEACGYFVFNVDLSRAKDKDSLLVAIGRDMAFPEWFGHNWDALADCLADLGWRPAEGYLVLLEHADALQAGAEDDFVNTLKIFAEAADEWREQGIALWCLVDMQSDGIAWLRDF